MNPTIQEVIDELLDQKAKLQKDYEEVKAYIYRDPHYAYPILFDIEEEMEELNDKYQLLMRYTRG